MRINNKIILGVVAFVFAMAFSLTVSAIDGYTLSVIQPETYDRTFTRDISTMSFEDCDALTEQQIFDRGNCSRVYFCTAIIPKTAVSIKDAVWRACERVSTPTEKPPIRVRFIPERGMKYAITTFIFWEFQQVTYNPDGTFAGYIEINTIPEEYKLVEEIIGLCEEGFMLRSNTCLPAQGICIDQFSTNMCTNEYEMWCLSYEVDAEGLPIFNCAVYPEHACVDRDLNGVCDIVVSTICSDINNNGICDSDEPLLWNSCIDENHNGICDDVETLGCFCTLEYNPVCVNSVTYPNSCFAECAGKTLYTTGECEPIEIVRQCQVLTDCPLIQRCLHLSVTCVDYQCVYVGECEQCQEDSDCPEAPCVGVAKQCGIESGRCQYSGKCLTVPESKGPWDKIVALWNQMWAWILSRLGWI